MNIFDNKYLYVILPEKETRNWNRITDDCMRAGVDCVQLRAKGMTDTDRLLWAHRIRSRIPEGGRTIFIVNDRADIALISRADGVHLGAGDIPPESAACLNHQGRHRPFVIGLTVHTRAELMRAENSSVSYLALGPLFKSPTKPELKAMGTALYKRMAGRWSLPCFAIGGITPQILPHLRSIGIRRVVMSSALSGMRNRVKILKKCRKIISE